MTWFMSYLRTLTPETLAPKTVAIGCAVTGMHPVRQIEEWNREGAQASPKREHVLLSFQLYGEPVNAECFNTIVNLT